MYAQHAVVEKPAKTQTSIQLASYLVKTPYSYSEDVSLYPLCGHEFEILKPMGYSLLQWWPRRDHVTAGMNSRTHSVCSCVMHTAWYVSGRLSCPADSIARCHSRQYFSINQLSTGGSYVEKPAETSHLVRAPYAYSGGFEFEFLCGHEHGTLISWKTYGVVQNTCVKEISTVTMAYKV